MRMALAAAGVVLLAVIGSTPSTVLLAQHETASDLLDGERAFRQSCANCHGPDGDLITGIDLGRGRFRRPMTDEDLVRIIRTGIPNTPMPASQMTEPQAQQIVTYLRSMAAAKAASSVTGDATRGAALFAGKGNCQSCHRIADTGSRVGPDLTSIGAARSAAELQRSLIDPAADVQPSNRTYRAVLEDGTVVEGRLLTHDTFTVQLIDSQERLRSFIKADLREQGFRPSPMPSYRSTFTPQETADVVAYLASLRGR